MVDILSVTATWRIFAEIIRQPVFITLLDILRMLNIYQRNFNSVESHSSAISNECANVCVQCSFIQIFASYTFLCILL